VRTAEGRLYLFVAIDRTSKFAFVELLERADIRAASSFLGALLQAVPYRIHSVLTAHASKKPNRFTLDQPIKCRD
jgi:transposase-like protein